MLELHRKGALEEVRWEQSDKEQLGEDLFKPCITSPGGSDHLRDAGADALCKTCTMEGN